MSNIANKSQQSIENSFQSELKSFIEKSCCFEKEILSIEALLPPLLKQCSNQTIKRNVARKMVVARYEVANFFACLLEKTIEKRIGEGHNSSDRVLQALTENLEEELGGYDFKTRGRAHELDRKVLLEALDINYESWVSNKKTLEQIENLTFSASKTLLKQYVKLINKSSLIGSSALLYYEGRIHRNKKGDYHHIIKGLEHCYPEFRKKKYKEGDPLYHIFAHAHHDLRHEKELIQAHLESIVKENQLSEVVYGVLAGQFAWTQFWHDLSEEIIPNNQDRHI